jgi:hypothetical protein
MGVRLTDDEAWAFLEAGHTGIFTTLRADGWPVSLPVWFVVVDRRIYVGTPARAKKVARVRNDRRGCFLVEAGEAWTELAAVEVPVHASLVGRGGEADLAIAAIDVKYGAFRPAANRLPSATTKHYDSQALLRLEPAGPALTWDNARIRLNRPDKESKTHERTQ